MLVLQIPPKLPPFAHKYHVDGLMLSLDSIRATLETVSKRPQFMAHNITKGQITM